MGRFQIGFENPGYLWLLILLPILWFFSYKSLAGLGPSRRWIALFLRSAVVMIVIAALAGVQWIWVSDKTTVIYLLDQSDSIPRAKRDVMLDYAIKEVKLHRNRAREDQAGMIVFGREAAIELPPFDDDLPNIRAVESYMGATDATNLESALKLAQASFPEGTARRIVVITDGNETLGNATAVAQSMADAGIGIDVIPITLNSKAEVLVEKVDLPSNIRQGQPFETRIVINRYQETGSDEPVSGTLKLWRRSGSSEELILDEVVTLDREINVFPVQHVIEQPAGYTYEAEFKATDESQDSLPQNNQATAFAYVRGKGRILLIENWNRLGEYDSFIESLGRAKIEVVKMPSNQLFTSLQELQAFDAVILAGVPRSSGESANEISSFSDEQIEMLVSNTQQFGSGLLMLGGPEAFGAGGWANSELEKAMPVDFQIKNEKVDAVGALAMVLHASEIAQGNYWQKVIGRSALDVLGPMDYCGVLQYSNTGQDTWLWGGNVGMLRVGPNKQAMRARMSSMTPGDMPQFDPSMRMALAALTKVPASLKHMIIISDGDPSDPAASTVAGFVQAKIKISTVAVGAHGTAGHQSLQKIATATGGNYYVVTNARALPKIFIKEAMRVAKPLIYEPGTEFQPAITFPHEVLQGINTVPPITGFVLTSLKANPLVEVAIRSPQPKEAENSTILAMWNYGLGRSAVLTTDVGYRWSKQWPNWQDYDKFNSQLVRWIMRPTADEGKYTVATSIRDGKVQVVVNALDEEDRFKNFLEMAAIAVDPDLKPVPLTMRQQAPGRYVGEFEIGKVGSYLVNIMPQPGQAPITAGVNVPFSDEYRIRQSNMNSMEQLSAMIPSGGSAGVLTSPLDEKSLEEVLANDTFRSGLPKATSLKDVWPWFVVIGSALFFGDVLVRRVSIDPLGATRNWIQKVRGKQQATQQQQKMRLDRLRQTKQSSTQQSAPSSSSQWSSTSFEPSESTPSQGSASDELSTTGGSATKAPPKPSTGGLAAGGGEESYTSRLLQAKKSAQKNRPNNEKQ